MFSSNNSEGTSTPRSRRAYNYEPVASPDDKHGHDGYVSSRSSRTDDIWSNTLVSKCLPLLLVAFLTAIAVHTVDRRNMTNKPQEGPLRTSLPIATHNSSQYHRLDPNTTAIWPRIAWLMSFPNSGTTYTIEMVSTTTNLSTGTNYGEEVADGETEIPIHADGSSWNMTDGPFWKYPELSKPLNGEYVMTKTHCGGRCTMCQPSGYVETTRSFELACRTGNRRNFINNTRTRPDLVTYDDDVVQRAIHLTRNPFDNIVARLHLDLRKWETKGDRDGKIWNYTSDREGLKAWCAHMDEKSRRGEEDFRLIDSELIGMENGLPCHAEFFRYIQWHNQAIEVTRKLKLPVLYLFYENYTNNFDETVSNVLDFLNMERVASAPSFITGKHYEHYFEPHEMKMGARLIKELATEEAWSLVKHYVEQWV